MKKEKVKKYKKKLAGRALAKLFFERDDYRERHQKLVGRVKIQNLHIEAAEAAIKKLESRIANDGLALLLAKQRAAELESFVALKRPDIVRLGNAVAKQKAAAAAGNQRPINVTLVQRRHHPKVSHVQG